MLLQDRRVLITGAGRGIGQGVALAVAEAGGHVAALDMDSAAAQQTAAQVQALGRRAVALAADVTDVAALDRAFEAAAEGLGGLDGLVNAAGVLRMGPALDATPADWGVQLQVNLQALAEGCRLAALHFGRHGRGGSIVNVASNAGKVGYPNMAAYNASKAAVISLTRSLSGEWAPLGINVNAVCPGGVETPMLGQVAGWIAGRTGGDPAALLQSMVPAQLGRHIQPIEVGRVVAFLLSDQAEIIRGQSINVDGGDTPY
jgi:meso-butanediol dehydrogenase/(S,S)-butanediol dehydrogenase/diacetyl reductase